MPGAAHGCCTVSVNLTSGTWTKEPLVTSCFFPRTRIMELAHTHPLGHQGCCDGTSQTCSWGHEHTAHPCDSNGPPLSEERRGQSGDHMRNLFHKLCHGHRQPKENRGSKVCPEFYAVSQKSCTWSYEIYIFLYKWEGLAFAHWVFPHITHWNTQRSYRERFGSSSALPQCLCPFFGRTVGQVQHPGPYTCFCPIEGHTQTDQPQISIHLRSTLTEESKNQFFNLKMDGWRERGQLHKPKA